MDDDELAARKRLEPLFAAFDRLTPTDLAGIGYRLAPDEERGPMLAALDEAAQRTGREALVAEARGAARQAVMTRFSAGSLQPTFIGLNWGVSQGTVESRVAIAETLADAAAAAVLEDVLDPDLASALSLDAAEITDLATGEASLGSLAQAIRAPEDPELGQGTGERNAMRVATVVLVAFVVFVVAWAGFAKAPSVLTVALPALVVAVVTGVRGFGPRGTGSGSID